MIFVGNYKDWVQQTWIDEVLSKNGFEGRIVATSKENKDRYAEYEKAVAAGWALDYTYWWRYTKENTSFDIKDVPWLTGENPTSWWIVKQTPGQVQPMHVDVDKNNRCRRFWIPLQDYQPGHILVNENVLITDYKLGDVYEFDTPLDYHGSANIGMSTRTVLLITEHLE